MTVFIKETEPSDGQQHSVATNVTSLGTIPINISPTPLLANQPVLAKGQSWRYLATMTIIRELQPRAKTTKQQARGMSTTRAFRLLDLPEEVLEHVVRFVKESAFEESQSIENRKQRYLFKAPEDDWGVQYYSIKEDHLSILNSFQSLASVNRNIYCICRPLLWKV